MYEAGLYDRVLRLGLLVRLNPGDLSLVEAYWRAVDRLRAVWVPMDEDEQ